MSKKILLVEDEEMLALITKDMLELKNYKVEIAKDGKMALTKFSNFKPDLVILDIMIPTISGYEVATTIRKKNQKVPIIFLSAKSQTTDVLKGFDLGANDYLTKPFSMEELLARVSVQLRMTDSTNPTQIYSIGAFSFNFPVQELTINSNKTVISYRESQVLKYLAEIPNEVVEKKMVLMELWGDNSVSNSRNMDVVVTKLRNYLKDDPRVKILNSRGVGYKLVIDE
ncbi:response regulator transcription factor [soil metagenome]